MAITRQPTAQEIGTVFAARAREESVVRDLWVTTQCDGVHLWMLIEPLEDDDAERALYGLIDIVDERFPETDIQLHVMNPLTYTRDPRESLPTWAEQIPLRAV
jgi:hypothetical protein